MKKNIRNSLESLIECLDRLGEAQKTIELVKNRFPNISFTDEIFLDNLVYDLSKYLEDAYWSCIRGCAYAEYPGYMDGRYESREAQAVDALRCLIADIMRRLTLMLYYFHGKLSNAIYNEKKLPYPMLNLILEAALSIAGVSEAISEDLEKIKRILGELKD